MSKSGPIILIDDDNDDQKIFRDSITELGISNELKVFSNCEDALYFLQTTTQQPFVIFCDVALPGKSGLEFKKEIDSTPFLRKKSIPFVFFATMAKQETVDEAYMEMTIQGFFKKPASFDEMKMLIIQILSYWIFCKHPNSMNAD